MTYCKEIGKSEKRKTTFRVEIVVEENMCEEKIEEMVKYLRGSYNKINYCSWMRDLADIIERG